MRIARSIALLGLLNAPLESQEARALAARAPGAVTSQDTVSTARLVLGAVSGLAATAGFAAAFYGDCLRGAFCPDAVALLLVEPGFVAAGIWAANRFAPSYGTVAVHSFAGLFVGGLVAGAVYSMNRRSGIIGIPVALAVQVAISVAGARPSASGSSSRTTR